jgi:hypothetical protein
MGSFPSTAIRFKKKQHQLSKGANRYTEGFVQSGDIEEQLTDRSNENDKEVFVHAERGVQRHSTKLSSLDVFLLVTYSKINVARSLVDLMNQQSSRSFLAQYILRQKPLLYDLLEQVSFIFI